MKRKCERAHLLALRCYACSPAAALPGGWRTSVWRCAHAHLPCLPRACRHPCRWMDRLAGRPPTTRSVALLQLLRIEQEGAYAGLVGGSPGGEPDDVGEGGLDGYDPGSRGGEPSSERRIGGAGSWSARLEPRWGCADGVRKNRISFQ